MSETTFAKRLEIALNGERPGSFAKRSGIGDSTVRKYLQGSVPILDKAFELATALNVNLDWLAAERGPMRPASTQTQQMGRIQRQDLGDGPIRRLTDDEVRSGDIPDGFVVIPRLDIRASAGAGLVALQDNEPSQVPFSRQMLARLGVNPQHAQFLVADGDSMRDTISDGDLLLIDRSIDQVRSEGIYVITYFGEVKVKRVQLMRSGAVLLKSDNKEYQTEEVPPHEVPDLQVEGRVRWVGGRI